MRMHSAKALLDIPDLPEEAFKHIGDRKIKPQGDSGGGGSQPANTSQTTTTELPEWARPYAKDILSKGQTLTDVNKNPYQTYGGDRIAGFSPLQNQAMTGAQNMQPSEQLQAGTGLAGVAGAGALGVAGQANPQGFQNQVGGYMNPYLQMALAPQLAEANRQYDISGTKQQSAATQAGAFGGSREAIMAAENERNRNMGLQNIVGQGYNTAFNNAQNQYNTNNNLQLQGLGLANTAAGTLGNLGNAQFQQGMDINKLQSGYGAMEQAQQQKGLDTAYQDFLNQQNYPYKQLGFMSDLLRGTPTGSSSVTNMYQGPGNVAGQIAGLGIGAMGLSKFMADGGLAGGGQPSVEDPQNIEAIVGKLSDAQLDQALKAAMQRGDAMEIEAIKQEQAMRASERNGLASTVTPQMTEQMMPSAANGGIVAFADNRDQPVSEDMPATDKKPYKTYEDDPTSKSYGRTIGEKRQSTIGKGLEQIGVNDALEAFNRFNINSMKGAAGVEDPETYRAAIEQSPGLFEKLTPKEREQRVKNTKDLYQNSLKKESYKTIDTPEGKADLEAKIRATMGNKVLPQPDTSKVQEQIGANANWGTVPAGSIAGEKKKGLGGALAVGQAVKNVAQNTGVPEQALEDRALSIYKKFKDMNKEELKSLNDAIEGQKGEADKIKEKGLSEALMQFGFNMAANAAKPGTRQGLSGIMGSASSAAPIIGQVASENEKLQRAAKDNYMKLKMDQTRYQVALDKGDMQAATALAAQIRQGDMQQKQLDALVDYHNKSLALEQQKLGVTAHAYAPQSVREAEWLEANKNNPSAIASYEKATRGRDAATVRSNSAQQMALEKSLEELRKRFPMLGLPSTTPEHKQALKDYQAEANRVIERHRKFFNDPTLGSPDIGGGATVNPNIKVLN